MKAKKQIVLEWALVWAGVSIAAIALMGMLASGCVVKIPWPLPTPTPTPTPTPIPTPEPTTCPDGFPPGPSGCPAPKPGGDIAQGVEWEVVGTAYPSPDRPAPIYAEQLDGVIARVTGCAINSSCSTNQTQQDFQYHIVSELRLLGLFAGQQHVDLDEIAVGLNPNEVQGYHIYNTGGGKVVWSTGADWKQGKGAYRDTWHARSAPDPGPNHCIDNLGRTVCGAPLCEPCPACPPLGRIVLTVRQQARLIVDATPQTSDKDWCNANGFAGRNNCPLGAEGTDQRAVCETKAGPYTWTVAGGSFFNNGDNPLQIVVTSHLPQSKAEIRGGNGVGAETTLP